MDVFEAVNSRIACRQFLEKPVDPNIVRKLIEGAARAASSSNLQPWNVYAVTGGPLTEIRRQAVEAIEQKDWRTLETEYPDMPENLWEPYLSRRSVFGAQLYSSLGINRDDRARTLEHIKQQFRFFNAPVGLFITIDRGLGPGQWADLGGYVGALAYLARGYGLDSCPQESWAMYTRQIRECVAIPQDHIFFCGMAIGHRNPSAPVNLFDVPRAPLSGVIRFEGFA